MDDLGGNNYNNYGNGGYNPNNNSGYNNGYGNGGYNSNGGGYNNGGYNNGGYNNGGYNNGYGYNNGGYNNGYGYNNGQNFGYNNGYEPKEKKSAGLAIASFVISLINLILCCTMLSIITVPLCLLFSIISLAKKKGGKVFAILGIVFSLIAGLAFVYYGKIVMDVMPDFVYFAEHQDEIIADYDRDGTIPDRFDKYRDPKYDKYWERDGFDSFDDFFEQFIEEYKRKNNINTGYEHSSGSGYSDLALGFQPALVL